MAREKDTKDARYRRVEVEKLAENTIGTCNDPDLDDFSDSELGLFDSLTLNCHDCGWWFEAHEVSEKDGTAKCQECNE